MEWLRRMGITCEERGLAGLKWAIRRPGRVAKLPVHLSTGIQGEDAAFFHLRRKGYVVVARRWSSGRQRGDLDLVAWQGATLCFIEVKTRTAHDIADAEAAVNTHKRNVLRALAGHYLRQLPMATRPPVRFDILSVYMIPGQPNEFVHFEKAFGWSDRVSRDDWA